MLTCEVSKALKLYCRQEKRKCKYNSYLKFVAKSAWLPPTVLNVKEESNFGGQQTSSILREISPNRLEATESDSEFLTKRTSQFDVYETFSVDTDASSGDCASFTKDDYDKYFSLLETEWKNLSTTYDQASGKKVVNAPNSVSFKDVSTANFNLAVLNEKLNNSEKVRLLFTRLRFSSKQVKF